MTAAGRLGVLGGTFDPVHFGHLILAEHAREQLSLDSVLFVPAGLPWRKADRAITGAEHRLEMLRLAIDDNPAFAISELETQKAGPSYTADTLAALTSENPGAHLYFILGEDALHDLPNWRDPARITALATLAVARRPGATESLTAEDESVAWISMPPIGVTSTVIRERVGAGLSIRYLTPDPVAAYIRGQRLYAATQQ